MNKLKSLILAGLLAVGLSSGAQAAAVCTGDLFNPVTDPDWNNMFPITVAGVRVGGTTNSPLMDMMPPICVCPSALGIPLPGIVITYWQPLYIAEIENRPGCLSSLGGIDALPMYEALGSQQSASNTDQEGRASNRMQVHWYEYPLFGVLDMLKNVSCKSTSGFNLGYMTELDPMWQNDLWANILAPESVLFASPPAQLACAADAVAANAGYPMDPLFWCQGSWGNMYPLAGNSTHKTGPFMVNNEIAGRFIARNHRTGLNFQTIGPSAMCGSHYNPIMVKSQYRYNQVAPLRRFGAPPVSTGSAGLTQTGVTMTHTPHEVHSVELIWQGQVCCQKPIP